MLRGLGQVSRRGQGRVLDGVLVLPQVQVRARVQVRALAGD
ncbi:MAG: hypothetical protein ACRDSH_20545 [Pseudonocardiaceae bacterium]